MDDTYYFLGAPVPRPLIFRTVRMWSKPGRAMEVLDKAEQATRAVRAAYADVPFRSYLARTFLDIDRVEVLAVSVWDTPEDMRRVIEDANIAVRPFREDTYGDALERWEVTTYEVFYPLPPIGEVEARLEQPESPARAAHPTGAPIREGPETAWVGDTL